MCCVGPAGLFISDKEVTSFSPHKAISRDTQSRWTIQVVNRAGGNTDRHASHSTHGAKVSKSRQLGISIKKILTHAGWKMARSFTKHYSKRLEKFNVLPYRLLTDQR